MDSQTKIHIEVHNEAKIVQKNLHLDEKAFKQFREKLKAQEEQYRKIQETTNHQHNEKVQEVEEKNYELEILGDQPEVKEKDLLSKDDEMDRLREREIGAEVKWYRTCMKLSRRQNKLVSTTSCSFLPLTILPKILNDFLLLLASS
ncbi:hypothetical protein ACET3Z_018341 [Daucus carota]